MIKLSYLILKIKPFFYLNTSYFNLAVFFITISFTNDVELSYAIKDAAEQLPVFDKLSIDGGVFNSRFNIYNYDEQSVDACVTHLAADKAVVSSVTANDVDYLNYCKEVLKIRVENPNFEAYTCDNMGLDKSKLEEYDFELMRKHLNGEMTEEFTGPELELFNWNESYTDFIESEEELSDEDLSSIGDYDNPFKRIKNK